MTGRSTLTWLDTRGQRTGFMCERTNSALLRAQVAWATLAGREPLLNKKPPHRSTDEAWLDLQDMLKSPSTRSMAQRAIRTLGRT